MEGEDNAERNVVTAAPAVQIQINRGNMDSLPLSLFPLSTPLSNPSLHLENISGKSNKNLFSIFTASLSHTDKMLHGYVTC